MKKKKKINAKKIPSARTLKARAFFKRYWYWFVVIPLLIGGILGWCAGMGYFNAKELVLPDDEIVVAPMSYYRLGDYVGKEKVSYSVPSQYSDVLAVSDGILYAKKYGEGKIVVNAGRKRGEISVEVSPYVVRWVLGVGDEIDAKKVTDFPNAFYPVNSVNYASTDVFYIDEDESVFVAKKEGVAIITYYAEDVPVCELWVSVRENVSEEQRSTKALQLLSDSSAFYEEQNVTGSEEVELGLTLLLTEYGFSGNGVIYFESSAPEVASVYQNGQVNANMPGSALVTVACVGDAGMEYKTIKVTVPVAERTIEMEREINARNPRVGETITEEMMHEVFYNELVVRYDTESPALTKTAEGFLASYSTENYVYIDGYSADGKKIVRYKMIIDEAEANGE